MLDAHRFSRLDLHLLHVRREGGIANLDRVRSGRELDDAWLQQMSSRDKKWAAFQADPEWIAKEISFVVPRGQAAAGARL